MDTSIHSRGAAGLLAQERIDSFVLDTLPRQGRWHPRDYLWLTDHSRRLVELTDGFIEVLPMPTDEHQSILAHLYEVFSAFLHARGGKALFAPLRLRIRGTTFREPDLLIVRDAADPRRDSRFWSGADVVIEIVSPDQPERDFVHKRHDYAVANIPEYWIVDPRAAVVTVLELRDGTYVEHGAFARGALATSTLLRGFSADVNAIFDAPNA